MFLSHEPMSETIQACTQTQDTQTNLFDVLHVPSGELHQTGHCLCLLSGSLWQKSDLWDTHDITHDTQLCPDCPIKLIMPHWYCIECTLISIRYRMLYWHYRYTDTLIILWQNCIWLKNTSLVFEKMVWKWFYERFAASVNAPSAS